MWLSTHAYYDFNWSVHQPRKEESLSQVTLPAVWTLTLSEVPSEKTRIPPSVVLCYFIVFIFLNVNNVTDATLSKRKQTFHYYAYFHQYLAYPYLQIVLSRLG